MVLKTELKVDVSCEKCKQKVISIISNLRGVDRIDADSEKGTLTVTGEADPHAIITCLRKAKKKVQFVSVGPLPPKEEKKPDPKPDPEPKWDTYSCPPVTVVTMGYQDPAPPACSIM